jgi:MoxR-like ATPase
MPFLVMATQNPVEQEGTYPLPEAQLDRFFFKVLVGSPTREELSAILDRTTAGVDSETTPVLTAERIIAHQKLVRQVAIAPTVQDYAVRMVLATHAGESFATPMVNKYVRLGASPRAAQTIVLAAKCRALIDGRPTVSVEDIRGVALPSLRHRLMLNFEAAAEGVTTDAVVKNIAETLPLEG